MLSAHLSPPPLHIPVTLKHYDAWLTHSKKQHCDACKHPYSFTKVLRRLVQQFFSALLFSIRAILVTLPWTTLWTWRAYFTMGGIAEGPSTVFNVTLFPNLSDPTQAWFPLLAMRLWWFVDRERFTRRADVHPIAATVQVETEGTVVDCSIRSGVYAPHPSLRHPLLSAPNSCLASGYRPMEAAFKEAGCLVELQREGGWRRVPANANITIVQGVRATVEVTEDGRPINEAEARLLELQNAEAEQHKRNVDEDYTLVYTSPMVAGPVLLNRRFFLLFAARQVHDGYSFVVGFHLLWGCWFVAQAIERLDRHRQRKENGSPSYMAFFLVFVIPTLIGLVMEMYVLLPIKLIYDPNLVVKVKLAEMWVLGLFYTKVILRLPGFEAPQRMDEGI
ncbi:hypothetical protein BDM02DRAFT_3190349 [Thelephora ganbajun]|uniref:Uncharacterized protein n=1 Tax=Thelephora ganbajun TaxID=370292 RepID=A0ACB6Z5Z8_THEGA|nr:hypothetical protein BDM02DRAFT_3190349 [Thelephora ganbajun]